MKVPERLRRYHTCARCGKERHRRRMYWNGREYICGNFDLCDEVQAFKKRVAEYEMKRQLSA